jgi:oligosaccharide repeat unit polymerase
MVYLINIMLGLSIGTYSTYRWQRLGFRLTSPVGLAAFIWCFVWLVHLLDVFGYYPVRVTTQWLSLLPIVALFVGEQLALSIRKSTSKVTLDGSLFTRILVMNSLVAILFAVLSLVSIYLLFGNPLEEGVGAKIKAARAAAGVGMLSGSPAYALLQYVVIARSFVYLSFLTMAVIWVVDKKVAARVGVATLLATLLWDVSWASRALILDFSIFLFGAFAVVRSAYIRRRGQKKMALAAGAVLLVGLLVITASAITASTRPDRSAEIAGVQVPLPLYQLLVWYTSPLVTFDQTREQNSERTYGLMSGGGVLTVLHMTRLYRNEELPIYDIMYEWEKQNPYYRSDSYLDRGNIYTWLRYLYSDFGFPGLVVVPFIFGFVFGRTAKNVAGQAKPDILGYAVLALAFYIAGRSPLVMAFRPDYVVLAFCMVVVVNQVVRRSSPAGSRKASLNVPA